MFLYDLHDVFFPTLELNNKDSAVMCAVITSFSSGLKEVIPVHHKENPTGAPTENVPQCGVGSLADGGLWCRATS